MTLFHQPRERGLALMMVLSFVALITVLLVTFMIVVRYERSASRNYSQSLRAEQLALGAVEHLTDQLHREILSGSITANSTSNQTVYLPRNARTSRPARLGTIPALPNLVQRSLADQAAYTTAYPSADYVDPPENLSSPSNSSSLNLNGRSVSRSRWNRASLGTFPTALSANTPDWIFVTREGPRTAVDSDLPTLLDTTNPEFTIGRYAYAVYDTSGLINLNNAGYPSSGAATFSPRMGTKGSVVWADLTRLGLTQAQVDGLVAWRNRTTATSPAAFLDFADRLGARTGFSRILGNAGASDNAFLSRQDLIQYARDNNFESSLPFLTHFSNQLDAPSHAPASTDATFNPHLATIQLAGKPLRRFPLEKLALLEIPNPDATQLDEIQRYFGLEKGPDFSATHRQWNYTAGSGAAAPIKTLTTVATENRQPNLFEVLLAGIARPSLGVNTGDSIYNSNASDSNLYHQVARIGAALIDQADTDGYPTILNITDTTGNAFQFYGIENLPYFSELFVKFRYIPATTTIEHYVFFELWNPHRVDPSPTASRPSSVRIAVNPQGRWMIGNQFNAARAGYLPFSFNGVTDINIGNLSNYATPRVVNNPGNPHHFSFGTPALNFNGWRLADTLGFTGNRETFNMQNAIFQLQYEEGGNWRTYTTFGGLLFSDGTSFNSTGLKPTGVFYWNSRIDESERTNHSTRTLLSYVKSDPRTMRFGASLSQPTWLNYSPMNASTSPNGVNQGWAQEQWIDQQKPSFMRPPLGTADFSESYLGRLWSNRSNQNRAPDRDNVFRPGDGWLTPNTQTALRNGAAYDDLRPIILNRPFRSVAELGHVFRDQPWKTLDFNSADSADAALLDLFCMTEKDTGIEIRQDTINPNTPHPEVLAALLVGAERNPYGTGSGNSVSTTSAQTLADRILAATSATPWTTAGSLVTAFPAHGGIAPTLTNTAPTVDAEMPAAKIAREALARNLASASGTRTWNLMIDVIAQSGRFSPTATDLDQFRVEGERRYWVHLAIDRYTGEVIARQLEPVYE